jgi:hypothetical protein
MIKRRSRKYDAEAKEGGGIGPGAVGETDEIAYVATDMRTTQGQAALGRNV